MARKNSKHEFLKIMEFGSRSKKYKGQPGRNMDAEARRLPDLPDDFNP